MRRVPRVALLALAVGLVLADSSIVTLGLPDVLEAFDATPTGVSWVLTGYNLVLALAALPAAAAVRRAGPAKVAAVGIVVFAAASLACALAPSLGVLVAARCVQGVGGAAVAVAALPLLVGADRRRGLAIWGVAGALGAAVGPALGGLLTEVFAWEAIFVVQVPLALACAPAVLGARAWSGEVASGGRAAGGGAAAASGARATGGADRPDVRSLLALAGLGAGLTAALFLLVLLLIAGWRESPLLAALTVSVMPAAALVAARFGDRATARHRGIAGALLVAGGLAALGLLPEAGPEQTIAPQVLVGLGLGLALGALTEAAIRNRAPLTLHGAHTIAARHAGVVAALALLTPVFTADLETQTDRAQESALAQVLDARVAPDTKIDLGLRLAAMLETETGRVPEVGRAFAEAARGTSAEERAGFATLAAHLGEELDRAATSAFERSFLLAAVLALLGAVPLALPPAARSARR